MPEPRPRFVCATAALGLIVGWGIGVVLWSRDIIPQSSPNAVVPIELAISLTACIGVSWRRPLLIVRIAVYGLAGGVFLSLLTGSASYPWGMAPETMFWSHHLTYFTATSFGTGFLIGLAICACFHGQISGETPAVSGQNIAG